METIATVGRLTPVQPALKDWPQDFKHENGFYSNLCASCGSEFNGHKRRILCRSCSDPAPILLDCDDVLLDWIAAFRIYCEDRLGRSLDPVGPASWEMGVWMGVEEDRAKQFISAFNASYHFSALPPVEGAAAVLQALHKLNHPLHVITSCSTDPEVVAARHENLLTVFGDLFTSITCLPLGTPKSDELAKHSPGIWIEDNYKHGLAGIEAGHRVLLRRRPHNRSFETQPWDGVEWVDDWAAIRKSLSV